MRRSIGPSIMYTYQGTYLLPQASTTLRRSQCEPLTATSSALPPHQPLFTATGPVELPLPQQDPSA